jgi:hypothetical protein
MTREDRERLDRLERRIYGGAEIEDLRETDIAIYGLEAVKEIYRTEGRESLQGLLNSSELRPDEIEMIADFLRLHK